MPRQNSLIPVAANWVEHETRNLLAGLRLVWKLLEQTQSALNEVTPGHSQQESVPAWHAGDCQVSPRAVALEP